MYIAYVDEYGDTGLKLADPQRNRFALMAALVPERSWTSLEQQLVALMLEMRESLRLEATPRLHVYELYQRRGPFKNVSDEQRAAWIERVLRAAQEAGVRYQARIMDKTRMLADVGASLNTSWLEVAAEGKAPFDPYVGHFAHLLLDIQGFLESEDQHALILVDQHDRTKTLASLNIYRAWRTVGVADRILESPIQRDGRVHTLLALPDFAAYVALSVHADKMRGTNRPHVEAWSKTYVYPSMTGYTSPRFSVERTLAVSNFWTTSPNQRRTLAVWWLGCRRVSALSKVLTKNNHPKKRRSIDNLALSQQRLKPPGARKTARPIDRLTD